MDIFGNDSERQVSGPGPADWLAGLVRGFHPLRLLLCLAGLIFSGSSLVVAMACFDWAPPNFSGWWQEPIEHAQSLRDDILGGSAWRAVVRGVPLLTFNVILWCLIGGCLARQELVARRSSPYDTPERPAGLSTAAFMLGWWKSLLGCFPVALLMVLLSFSPIGVASFVVTWCGGFGAVIVAVLLPVLLVASLILLIFVFGSLSWPLMPVAVAAECNDQFDAVARSINYLFQRPISFLLLTSFAVGLACLPLGCLSLVSEQIGWQSWARQIVILIGAGFAASLFWSLETQVYLHLRWAIDNVDAGTVADAMPEKAPSPEKALAEPAPAGETPLAEPALAGETPLAEPAPAGETPPAGAWKRIRSEVLLRVAVIASWCMMYWLLGSFSSESVEWLGWVLCGQLVPPAEGLYRVASIIAVLWLLGWLAFPTVVADRIRRRKSTEEQDKKAEEPSTK